MHVPATRSIFVPGAVLALLAVFASQHAGAREITPPADIAAAALSALGLQGTGSEARVDQALRLSACAAPLVAVATGPRTVQVACNDVPGWRVYVPVRVSRNAPVAVLTRPVAAGESITPADVAIRERRIGGADPDALADPALVVGQTATRALAPGATLAQADLAEGRLLQRGDPVVLVSRAGGIEVRMQGRSLGRAAPGEAVAVENTGSRRIVRGRWAGDGRVEVVR